MRLTTRVKLNPTIKEHAALTATLSACNNIANKISEYAHSTGMKRKYDLHHAQYAQYKEQLGSQALVRTIAKVSDAYTTQKGLIKNGVLKGKRKDKAISKPIQFREDAAQAFDKNNLSYNLDHQTVSIYSVKGRLKQVRFECSAKQLEQLRTSRKGETDLILVNGNFYLIAGIEVPEAPLREVVDYLAFDSGIVNIATTSDGHNWSGGAVTLRRKKNRALRAKLQAKGTKSAKRLLKKRSKKETRFVRDVNHCISKEIIRVAEHTGRGIAHENLKGIRERARSYSKPLRTKLAGIPVKIVEPAYSSQLCPVCGSIGRENRRSQALFKCVNCGKTGPADFIAARNIRSFALT